MAALNFPSSPSNGQTYTANNVTYVWNGTAWKKNIPSQSSVSGINTVGGVVGIANDLDVDGHTNLDNISVAGISTFNSDVLIGDAVTFHDNGGQFQLKTGYFNVKSKVGEDMLIAYNNEYVRLFHDGNQKFTTTSTGAIVTGVMTATSFSGDGSNLTGTSVVKQVREATSTGQSGTTQTYTDKVSLTVDGISNNSRMIVIASYTLASATPFTSGRYTQGRCIKDGGSFEGEEIVNEYSGYGKNFYDILYDSANGAGSRTYKIQWRRLVQQTGYISNAKILAIELGIGP